MAVPGADIGQDDLVTRVETLENLNLVDRCAPQADLHPRGDAGFVDPE